MSHITLLGINSDKGQRSMPLILLTFFENVFTDFFKPPFEKLLKWYAFGVGDSEIWKSLNGDKINYSEM